MYLLEVLSGPLDGQTRAFEQADRDRSGRRASSKPASRWTVTSPDGARGSKSTPKRLN